MSSLASPEPPHFIDMRGVVEVHGEVDLSTAPELLAVLDRAIDRLDSVIVDLRSCSFLDCSGLAALVAARDRAVHEDVAFAIVCGVNDPAQRLFDLAVPDLLMTFPDLLTAADSDPSTALRRWTA